MSNRVPEPRPLSERFSMRGVTTDALRDHVVERLTHAINQHEAHVASVSVHLEDVNGPNKGGDDQRFNVIVHLREGGDIVVDERGADAYSVISTGADRVKQAVGRKLDRLVDRHHHHAPTL